MSIVRLPLRWMRSAVSCGLRKIGFDIVRITDNFDPKVGDGFLCIQKVLRNSQVDLVADVGAGSGAFAREVIALGYEGPVICFEPLSHCHESLERLAKQYPQIQLERCALGESASRAEINVAGNSVSSSLLPMKPFHTEVAPDSKYVCKEMVEIRTLDQVLGSRLSEFNSIFLKLDVQGFEREVLSGAAQTMKNVRAAHVELSPVEFYVGQARMLEVLDFFGKEGFILHAIFPVFIEPGTGRHLQLDAIFVRP